MVDKDHDTHNGLGPTATNHISEYQKLLRVRTVAELAENGWGTPKPYFDAALVCPSCQNTIEKEQIVPYSGESQTEAAVRVLYDSGSFERICHTCGATLYQNTTTVYDYFTEREGYGAPSFPYTTNDLPIDLDGYDPGPYAASVLMRYFHTQADFATEAEDVPWGLDDHVVRECPLCGTTGCELDFHHWLYNPDVGVALCRECHTAIHDGVRARDQSLLSHSGEWVDWALAMLVCRHRLSRDLPGAGASFWEIKHRYNIPFSTNRIESAYNQRYGDCDHEYVEPLAARITRCESCGELIENKTDKDNEQ